MSQQVNNNKIMLMFTTAEKNKPISSIKINYHECLTHIYCTLATAFQLVDPLKDMDS